MASDVEINKEYTNKHTCGPHHITTHLTGRDECRVDVDGGQTLTSLAQQVPQKVTAVAAEGAQQAGWQDGGQIGGGNAIVGALTPAEWERLGSIGHAPQELLRAGLELWEWSGVDSNARRRAKKSLGKVRPRKIVEKIRAIFEENRPSQAGIVAEFEQLAVDMPRARSPSPVMW